MYCILHLLIMSGAVQIALAAFFIMRTHRKRSRQFHTPSVTNSEAKLIPSDMEGGKVLCLCCRSSVEGCMLWLACS